MTSRVFGGGLHARNLPRIYSAPELHVCAPLLPLTGNGHEVGERKGKKMQIMLIKSVEVPGDRLSLTRVDHWDESSQLERWVR